MALANRLAIIAGGIGGIGSAAGKLLHSQGAKVALLYAPFEKDKLQSALKKTYGQEADGSSSNIKPYECDVTNPQSVQKAFKNIASDGAAFPSMLINSAGYIDLSPLEHHAAEEVVKHYNVNLLGPTLTSQAFTLLYKESCGFVRMAGEEDVISDKDKSRFPGGRIVNIASQAAHVALRNHGAYCASKAGLVGLTRSMASEWGPHGITANSISPGPVWTELGMKAWADEKQRELYQAAVPTGKFCDPEEIAEAVVYLCQDSSLNINGADLRMDGGYTTR
ncbi:NAD(P)-binding protein [Polychaeton citri CBS 116435]|uniref:NAD(P)-binding protein n=1 Tax=Polychaeton citri CBS 116435 TaxID=1314669 RepID=A0A9P4UV69_9PEZI|nr:NAD(P)-binding protein [Polychaeton citri CBS 116435]